MTRHVGRRRRRLSRTAAAALTAVAALAVLAGWRGSYALFTDSAAITAGPFSSGSIAAPVLTSATQTSTGQDVTLVWPATSVGTQTATATAYEVYRYAAATGGTGTLACSTTGALTCTDTSDPTGTVYYQLRAKFAANWFRDGGSRVAYTADTTPPTVVITNPINTCSGTTVACGTASDSGGGTVAKIEYLLLQKRTNLLGGVTYACWNGTLATPAYGATSTTPCTNYYTASGTTTWTVPGAKATAYPAAPFLGSQTITLTIRATDSFGNVSTTTAPTYSN